MDGETERERPPFKIGVFPDMPAETYHAIEALSAHGAAKILKTPEEFRLMRDTTKAKPSTAAQDFGTVVHLMVMEPALVEKSVAIYPEVNRHTNAGKQAIADFNYLYADRVRISAKDFKRAQRCAARVLANASAVRLLEGATLELSIFWIDTKYQVPCKTRIDIFAEAYKGIADLKTCTDASGEEFGKDAANYNYHMQGAFNCAGIRTMLAIEPEFFALIAAESEEPHGVAVWQMPDAALQAGSRLMADAMARYASCVALGEWPTYDARINMLPFPKWKLRFDV